MSTQPPEKVPCRRCGALLLPLTAQRTGGLCRPCKQREALYPGGRAREMFLDYWARLEKVGWLSDLPSDQAREDLWYRLRAEFAEDPATAHLALATVFLPEECVEDNGDYVDILEALARGSHGFFRPHSLRDHFEPEEQRATVELGLGDLEYRIELPFVGDEPESALFDWVNQALA